MRKFPSDPKLPLTGLAVLGLTAILSIAIAPASAATITRSAEVKATPVGRMGDDRPVLRNQELVAAGGTCIEDGKTPPTRTLVTMDGKAAFVETQTARNDAEHSYSYTFLSSPLPVSNYTSTIKVTAKGDGSSTVTWSGSYTPDQGKDKAAE